MVLVLLSCPTLAVALSGMHVCMHAGIQKIRHVCSIQGPAELHPAWHHQMGALSLRHCEFELFATNRSHPGPDTDYLWEIVPALNGAKGAVSFQSPKFMAAYIAPIASSGVERARLGLQRHPQPDAASFAVLPGLKNASLVSFRSLATGKFISLSSNLTGGCAHLYAASAGEGDVLLAAAATEAAQLAATWHVQLAPPPPPVSLSVNLDQVTHTVSHLSMGCHSDSGYAHQVGPRPPPPPCVPSSSIQTGSGPILPFVWWRLPVVRIDGTVGVLLVGEQ